MYVCIKDSLNSCSWPRTACVHVPNCVSEQEKSLVLLWKTSPAIFTAIKGRSFNILRGENMVLLWWWCDLRVKIVFGRHPPSIQGRFRVWSWPLTSPGAGKQKETDSALTLREWKTDPANKYYLCIQSLKYLLLELHCCTGWRLF